MRHIYLVVGYKHGIPMCVVWRKLVEAPTKTIAEKRASQIAAYENAPMEDFCEVFYRSRRELQNER